MPLKLNLGLSKKLGQPNYGSVGASCHLELELDPLAVSSDPDGFQERVRRTFAVCRQAVDEELSGYGSAGAAGSAATDRSNPAAAARAGNGSANGSGHQQNSPGHLASDKQVSFARQLAADIGGLGPRKLDALAKRMFGKTLGALAVIEASSLIDTLKAMKAGTLDLEAALAGPASQKGAAA